MVGEGRTDILTDEPRKIRRFKRSSNAYPDKLESLDRQMGRYAYAHCGNAKHYPCNALKPYCEHAFFSLGTV